MGLVTKNGILLIEFANQIKVMGVLARDAMVRSGGVRLHPILRTAVSTISGILPIASGFGAGGKLAVDGDGGCGWYVNEHFFRRYL
ncbi:MAG: Swarming motility protein SwrC [Verrucomicrobia subdivision 3 bacterium]|nr:Swarming motility protein SwrC [Limisphaerales bacterium]MCS1414566.1 Swarming motility protein SwrC [Limisphaerales bacterium]